jgi:hypothetical protein
VGPFWIFNCPYFFFVEVCCRTSSLVSPGALHSSPVSRFVKTTRRISVQYRIQRSKPSVYSALHATLPRPRSWYDPWQ